MQLKILSDLHLEAPAAYDVFEIRPEKATHLALLGDIGNVRDEGPFEFLKRQLALFSVVFFLLGNHEPYHSDWSQAVQEVSDFEEKVNNPRDGEDVDMGKFVFLNRTRYDISSSTTILGCTLFSKVLPQQFDSVSFGMNDFYYIDNWTVEQHCEAHERDVAWLNEQVLDIANNEPDRKIVILTHYSPTVDPRSINPAHRESKISSGFSTDLRAEGCWREPAVKLWAFGHTHFNCDFEADGKRVYTNQRGYYFAQAAGFKERDVLELE
ncbi:MAG: hypothetical protein M1831_003871 [Alyxoria varia]|nr:MAG: hypothetical protein M1831_003871 [Alyxoria varia]